MPRDPTLDKGRAPFKRRFSLQPSFFSREEHSSALTPTHQRTAGAYWFFRNPHDIPRIIFHSSFDIVYSYQNMQLSCKRYRIIDIHKTENLLGYDAITSEPLDRSN
ncbi:hypothetical protein PGB90_008172 [Kerria lacca]